MATLLAVSQIATLPLDLMDGTVGALEVGDEGRGDAAGVLDDGGGVGGEADGGQGGEERGIGEAGGGGEAQPGVDGDEHGGVVDVADAEEHGEDGQGYVPRATHLVCQRQRQIELPGVDWGSNM